MRLWKIHPSYLDTKGLVACWREGLLAKKCLETLAVGKTCGYCNHPQLDPFKKCKNPVAEINIYLHGILSEGLSRGFNFDKTKVKFPGINWLLDNENQLYITETELQEEFNHLLDKLEIRDKAKHDECISSYNDLGYVQQHGMFQIMEGIKCK